MKRLTLWALLVGLGMAVVGRAPEIAAASADHTYFESLVARSDHWKSLSFRDPAQLADRNSGGYAQGRASMSGLWVTYDPTNDSEPHRQDAAKVAIPAFSPASAGGMTLATAVSGSATVIPLAGATANSTLISLFTPRLALKIDNEMMLITSYDQVARAIAVTRGAYGTAAAAHSAGATIQRSNNNLPNQLRFPINSEDGHTYLFTWDGYWTDSYLNMSVFGGHKAFQFSSGRDQIWLEPRTDFTGGSRTFETAGMFVAGRDIASVDLRSYNTPGTEQDWSKTDGNSLPPSILRTDPFEPRTNTPTFVIKPNTWTRFWLLIDQRASDWDYIDYWVADEKTGPVQLYRHMPVSVRPAGGPLPNSIVNFWLEYNTSLDYYRGSERDLVAYVRNFAVLRDVSNAPALLLRPLPGTLAPAAGPGAPKNVRILR